MRTIYEITPEKFEETINIKVKCPECKTIMEIVYSRKAEGHLITLILKCQNCKEERHINLRFLW